MTQLLDPIDFLKAPGTIFDVRSPAEYIQGHLPGALSLPLFTDAERSTIGTLYKHLGKEPAVEQGLAFVGPKLSEFVSIAKQNLSHGLAKVHCWRGGMRSSSMAWLLTTSGLKTATLSGGYKLFRRWVLTTLHYPPPIKVIGGLTGSGKTAILHALKQRGEQVLDLEHLACHRGSSYGMLGMPSQPTTEQFENEIACLLAKTDPQRVLWVEDESRLIGKCKIPDPLFHAMRAAPLMFVECPKEERLERLMHEYGTANPGELIAATERLARRLGGARTKEIISLIQQGDLMRATEMSLAYYDATYRYGLSRRTQKVKKISGHGLSADAWAELLIKDEY